MTVRCVYPAGAPVSCAGSAAMCTCVASANAVMPTNIPMVSTPMIPKVAAALRLFGFLKLGTPLLTASTPVNAVQPDANARSTTATRRRPPTLCSAWIPRLADSATGASPSRNLQMPNPVIASTHSTNP